MVKLCRPFAIEGPFEFSGIQTGRKSHCLVHWDPVVKGRLSAFLPMNLDQFKRHVNVRGTTTTLVFITYMNLYYIR